MGKKATEFKATVDWPAALEHMRSLMASLEAGGVRVSQGERVLDLSTQGSTQVSLEIEAKDKGDKCKLSVELSWSRATPAGEELNLAPLDTAAEPAPTAPKESANPTPESNPAPAAAAKPKAKVKPKPKAAAPVKPKAKAKTKPKAAAKTPAAAAKKNTRKASAPKRPAK
jgi:amphi-Trp domain-containing protein